MADRLRMIVVGAGRGRSHLKSFLALEDDFEVVGLVDQDEGRLKNALGEHELPTSLGFTSYEQAIADSGCDGVMVATWARTHAALIEQALDAGKHMMVEKPFAVELADARRLLGVAEGKGLKIVVNQQWRYMPGQRTIRRLMSGLEYGEPQAGHFSSYKARGSEYPDSPHSQLWQMTVHEIDSLIAMMNQPIVEVYGHSFRPPETTWNRESTATAELTFRNGCRVVLVSTSDARVGSCEFRAECERAALVYRNTRAFGGKESLFLGENRESGLQPLAIDEGPRESPLLDQRIAAGFVAWVHGGPEPETSGRNNLQVLGALDALMRSGASGKSVEVVI